jgi:hypothetical protein
MTKRPTLSNLQGQLASKRSAAPANPTDEAPKKQRRRGKPAAKDAKVIFVRLNVEGWRELRKLAVELDNSVQGIMVDAINNYLRENGHPAVAENPLA